MSEIVFKPLTNQLGIAGTNYRLQLGIINAKWAIRLLKGKKGVECSIFRDIEINNLPEGNQTV
ncbi:MAG: hypothetical protein ACFFDN_40285 [Candidatus Hodarchaeota archaeon]